jgi:hypothetical protein
MNGVAEMARPKKQKNAAALLTERDRWFLAGRRIAFFMMENPVRFGGFDADGARDEIEALGWMQEGWGSAMAELAALKANGGAR